LQLAAITVGPLFRPIDRWGHVGDHTLSSLGVARAVKRALTAIGLETTDYSGHSLRAGLVTAAAMAGVSERVIMQQTGHKNTAMLRRYIREGSLFRENAAAEVGLWHVDLHPMVTMREPFTGSRIVMCGMIFQKCSGWLRTGIGILHSVPSAQRIGWVGNTADRFLVE
jgi:hypothetical protein